MMMNLGKIKKQILLLSLSYMVLFCSSGLVMAQQSERGKSEVPFSSVPENVLAVAGEKRTSESIKPDDAPGRINLRDTAQDLLGTRYLTAVKKFADVALEKGRDTYGEKHTPLFVDALHIETHEPFQWKRNGESWTLSNLASQQNLFRTLVGLSRLTGDERYRQAAVHAVRYGFENLRGENGLLEWGGHLAYDADGDRLNVGGPAVDTDKLWAGVQFAFK